MEKHAPEENDPLKEDAREADDLWVSDDPYEVMKIMGFIPLEPGLEDEMELSEGSDRVRALFDNGHTADQIEFILEMETDAGIQFEDYDEALEWGQDPHNFTEEEQLQYIAELEERAGCAFEDVSEAREWERTHCGDFDEELDEEQESYLTAEDVELLGDLSDTRETKVEAALNRLARFELQFAPDLTVKNGDCKQTIAFRNGSPALVRTIAMDAREKDEVEKALRTIRAMERIDEGKLDEVVAKVFDNVRDTEHDKETGFDLER